MTLALVGRGSGFATVVALTQLGRLRARRGDPGAWPLLDEALELARPSGDVERLAPLAAARAEAAWLNGQPHAIAAETDGAWRLAIERRRIGMIGELALWRWRAGVRVDIQAKIPSPYALQIAGDWKQAAQAWRDLGCPYEAALALGDADDEDALRDALDQLHTLGARPAAAIVVRKLRKRGVRGVPRGPRPRTLENPAGLTARELDVLALLADGLRNAQIGERLVVSQRTVDHHVSAILRKLDVRTRTEAGAEAARLGLLAPR